MKFTIDIDCTPQEARTFFGLPDVTQLNETMAGNSTDKSGENK